MPTPSAADIDFARRSSIAAMQRLEPYRYLTADCDEQDAMRAAVETLWWARLLAEQLGHPNPAHVPLEGDGGANDEADLVAALRVVRNKVSHKVPLVTVPREVVTYPGPEIVPSKRLTPGTYKELHWIPASELPPSDPGRDKHDDEDKALYSKHLAARSAVTTLARAVTWLDSQTPATS